MCSSHNTIHKFGFFFLLDTTIPFPPIYTTFAPLSYNCFSTPYSGQSFSTPCSLNTFFPHLLPNMPLPTTWLPSSLRETLSNQKILKKKNYFTRSLSVDSFINKKKSQYSKESLSPLPCHFVYLASAIWNSGHCVQRLESTQRPVTASVDLNIMRKWIPHTRTNPVPIKTNKGHDYFHRFFLSGQENVWR